MYRSVRMRVLQGKQRLTAPPLPALGSSVGEGVVLLREGDRSSGDSMRPREGRGAACGEPEGLPGLPPPATLPRALLPLPLLFRRSVPKTSARMTGHMGQACAHRRDMVQGKRGQRAARQEGKQPRCCCLWPRKAHCRILCLPTPTFHYLTTP